MHRIEILKALLVRFVFRTFGQKPKTRLVGCLHTYDAIIEINKKFPEYEIDFLFKIISEEITIKQGKLTTFIWGYTKCARRIYNAKLNNN